MKPRLAAIVLAAGDSKRFGTENKLLSDWKGKPLVAHVVERLQTVDGIDSLTVVVGFEADRLRAVLPRVENVFNPSWEQGMGGSLALGVASTDADGYLIVLGDMPHVEAETLQRLIDAWRQDPGRPVVPGSIHPPLIVPSLYRPPIMALRGDAGCRSFLSLSDCTAIAVDEEELADIDV
jgi:molybdenum cofactor cytidylyltransferase